MEDRNSDSKCHDHELLKDRQVARVCVELKLASVRLDDNCVGVLMRWLFDRKISVENLQLYKNALSDTGAGAIAEYLLRTRVSVNDAEAEHNDDA